MIKRKLSCIGLFVLIASLGISAQSEEHPGFWVATQGPAYVKVHFDDFPVQGCHIVWQGEVSNGKAHGRGAVKVLNDHQEDLGAYVATFENGKPVGKVLLIKNPDNPVSLSNCSLGGITWNSAEESGIRKEAEQSQAGKAVRHRQEQAPPDFIRVSHILITPSSDSEAAHIEARNRARSLRDHLLLGDSSAFAEAARTESACPSRKSGGDLGRISRGQTVPEFEAAAFDLDVGEISPITKTQYGYHIILRTE